MIVTLKDGHSGSYKFKYSKKTVYKQKSISNLQSSGEFLLSCSNQENLELKFQNKSYVSSIAKDPLVFSPVKLTHDKSLGVFLVKNKESLKMQWDKYKEKYRNPNNLPMINTLERLYFHFPLGLEYDLLSSGPYIPFFLDLYNTDFNEDTVLRGMDWVLNPLSIPLSISYRLLKNEGSEMYLSALVSLDDEKLTHLIGDKNFQKQAKSYHFTRDFTIQSAIQLVYDLETGYLESSVFNIRIQGNKEELLDEISFEISRAEAGDIIKPAHRSFLV